MTNVEDVSSKVNVDVLDEHIESDYDSDSDSDYDNDSDSGYSVSIDVKKMIHPGECAHCGVDTNRTIVAYNNYNFAISSFYFCGDHSYEELYSIIEDKSDL